MTFTLENKAVAEYGPLPPTRECADMDLPGGGGGLRGEFSAGKIPHFKLVRNYSLIFREEIRNFPHAELCMWKPS